MSKLTEKQYWDAQYGRESLEPLSLEGYRNHGSRCIYETMKLVDFEGKKKISIDTDADTIYGVDYVWLFEKFSEKIKENIKKDKYNELMTSNFSTTTPVSKIASQISWHRYKNFLNLEWSSVVV